MSLEFVSYYNTMTLYNNIVSSTILKSVNINIFWDVTLCSLVNVTNLSEEHAISLLKVVSDRLQNVHLRVQ
jgi:hypothetical protein